MGGACKVRQDFRNRHYLFQMNISIGLHIDEETPMTCRECGEELDIPSMFLQCGDITSTQAIQKLCDKCARKSSQTQNPNDQRSTDNK